MSGDFIAGNPAPHCCYGTSLEDLPFRRLVKKGGKGVDDFPTRREMQVTGSTKRIEKVKSQPRNRQRKRSRRRKPRKEGKKGEAFSNERWRAFKARLLNLGRAHHLE